MQRRRLGIIASPGWIDPNAEELRQHYPGQLEIAQTILPPPGFDYSMAAIAQSEPHLVAAAKMLAEAGSELIIQDGPGFAYLIGGTPHGARQLGERVSHACSVPVVLNGVAVLDAIDRLGAKRLAVACPYYSPEWKAMFTEFLGRGGYRVESFQTFVEQGIFKDQAAVSARRYQFTDEEVAASLRRTRETAPDADAMVIGGSGLRSGRWRVVLERELGLPLVVTDASLHRAVAERLGLQPGG
jgi:maleate cis-trans isomerase